MILELNFELKESQDNLIDLVFTRGSGHSNKYAIYSVDELRHLHKKLGYYLGEHLRQYEVYDVDSVEDFFAKYHVRNGPPDDYYDASLKLGKKEFEIKGYSWINHLDSVTGEDVSFFKK